MESFKFDRQLVIDGALILFGSFLLATGYSLFLAPAHISPGGVYGLALVIRELLKQIFHMEVGLGTIALFFNVPLFLLAMHGLGKVAAVKTIVTFILVALFSDLIDTWFAGKPLVEDAILCSFYGGAILGVSVWMIFRAQSTCAGTDTLARVLSRTFNTKVSTLIMFIDSIVVLLGLWVFEDWRVPLYSWIAIFIYRTPISLSSSSLIRLRSYVMHSLDVWGYEGHSYMVGVCTRGLSVRSFSSS